MNCQRPTKNPVTNKWEVWDFSYEEDGERYYELHDYFEFDDAMKFWQSRNPKSANL